MKTGFTLIELLVVVLIIGILSAVALPQYELAVAKTRVSTMLALVKAVDMGQKVFYMANGFYAVQFDDLDIDMPSGGTPISPSQIEYPNFLCYLRPGSGEDASVYCNDLKSGARLEKYYINTGPLCWTKIGTPPSTDMSVRVCKSLSGKAVPDGNSANGYAFSL